MKAKNTERPGVKARISPLTPYLITLNCKELRPFRKKLMKGNEWAYLCSPVTASFGLPAASGDCAFGMEALLNQVRSGRPAFYCVYTKQQIEEDPTRAQVGIYCLENPDGAQKPYVAMIAGGGFTSVCTLWESLPVAAAFREQGYTSFCIQYRTSTEFGKAPATLMEDVAACISYISNHGAYFGVETQKYLLGGFSAGSRTASMWANEHSGWGKYGLPKPSAVCLMYGLHQESAAEDDSVPTFCRYCLHDQYVPDYGLFTALEARLKRAGIPCDFKCVDAGHGFGLGSNTEAEGWTKEAEAFWLQVRK